MSAPAATDATAVAPNAAMHQGMMQGGPAGANNEQGSVAAGNNAAPNGEGRQPNSPPASLYVGQLHPDVNEPILYSIFKKVGPIMSVRVCRDRVSRRSLGYAFVNFYSQDDAETCFEKLNYMEIKGKPCRIMPIERDPNLRRRSGKGNIFINHLHADINDQILHNTMATYGRVLSCRVQHPPKKDGSADKQETGCGFVQFAEEADAEKAIASVNGRFINNVKVEVMPFIAKNQRAAGKSPEETYTNVYMKFLDYDVTDEKLRSLTQEYGTITACCVMTGGEDGKSKGFGYVNFADHESAVKAVTALNGKVLPGFSQDGKGLVVARATSKAERQRAKDDEKRKFQQLLAQYVNLYVKNIPPTVAEDELRAAFAEYGELGSVRLMTDPATRQSKGFGFVAFVKPESAKEAVAALHGSMRWERPLHVCLFQPKAVRQSVLNLQQMTANRGATGMAMPPYGMIANPGMMQANMYGNAAHMFNPMQQQQQQQRYGQQQMPMNAGGGAWQQQQMPVIYPGGPPQQNRGRGGAGHPAGGRGGAGRAMAAAGGKDVQYHSNVANVPAAPMGGAIEQVPQQAPQSAAAEFAVQDIGEKLFQQLTNMNVDDPGKITGMLLELDRSELFLLMEDRNELKSRVEEAIAVLKKATHDGVEDTA